MKTIELSWYDFLQAVDGPATVTRQPNATQSHLDPSFTGIDNGACKKQNVTGWMDGARKLIDAQAQHDYNTGRRRWTWSYDDGAEGDHERCLAGRAFLRTRKKREGNRRGRCATIRVNVSESGRIGATSMVWKAYAAATLADQLQLRGIGTKITSEFMTKGASTNNEYSNLHLVVTVKDYNEPLNLGHIAQACAPWQLRCNVFEYMTKHIPAISRGKGAASKIDALPGEIVINQGECLSQSAAKTWLSNTKI